MNASLVDLLVYMGAWIVAAFFVETPYALVALLFMLLFFEPLCIRLAGQTPGQAVTGIRVVAVRGHLGFLRLWARWFLKGTIGGLSLFYAWFNAEGAALHDLATGTALIDTDANARARAPSAFSLPGAPRRFVVALLWYGVAAIVATIAVMLTLAIVAPAVLYEDVEFLSVMNLFLAVVDIAIFVYVLKWGAEGRLLGARRKPLAVAP